MHKIGEVAELAKVSIRLLRHYDEIGLLVPSGRSEAGYRLYAHTDLQRLQQILFYRTLEFPLEEIQKLMTAPGFDRHAALLQQRELIGHRAQQLGAVLDLIDKTIAEIDPKTGQEKSTMNTKEMFEVFPDMKHEYQVEAQERWGDTEAWKQSTARWNKYTKADMERMKQMMRDLNQMLQEKMQGGEPDFDGFMQQYGDLFGPNPPQNLEELVEQMQRQVAQMQNLLDSLPSDMRQQLQDLLMDKIADRARNSMPGN